MKTTIHHISYPAQFFLEWEIFQMNLQRTSKFTFCAQETFFFKSCLLWDNIEKYCRVGQATDDNMARAHCMLDYEDYKHTQIV